MVGLLRAHRARQQELLLLAGTVWGERGLVCCSRVGTPLGHANVLQHFHTLRGKARVPRIRVYDLRHSAISLMVDAGDDLKSASGVMGHSNPGITTRVYRHVRQDQRTDAMHRLAATLDSPPLGNPEEPYH